MNILWFCNAPVGEAYSLYGLKKNPFGGWLEGLSASLSAANDMELTIAFCGADSSPAFKRGEKINYISYDPHGNLEACVKEILEIVKPDVIHIHGIEFSQHNEISKYLDPQKYVVSIQGIKTYYAYSYIQSIDWRDSLIVPFTAVGLAKGNILRGRKQFSKFSKTEKEMLQRTCNVIGRTTWDRACVTQMNPSLQYHFNNENLRAVFYESRWDINRIKRNSIFVSQVGYPIKGGHMLIKAIDILRRKYPDIHVYIAGANMLPGKSFRSKMYVSAYGHYLNKLIKKCRLQNHITFTGVLSDIQMRDKLLESHVFVLPSFIENSPNSLGEAMLLGMPCVASCVGGVQDMLRDREEGYLYPADEFYMLAHYIDCLLSDDNLATAFGAKAHEHAVLTHDWQKNVDALIEIYKKIDENSKGSGIQ